MKSKWTLFLPMNIQTYTVIWVAA